MTPRLDVRRDISRSAPNRNRFGSVRFAFARRRVCWASTPSTRRACFALSGDGRATTTQSDPRVRARARARASAPESASRDVMVGVSRPFLLTNQFRFRSSPTREKKVTIGANLRPSAVKSPAQVPVPFRLRLLNGKRAARHRRASINATRHRAAPATRAGAARRAGRR
jgi:hypothetical protein